MSWLVVCLSTMIAVNTCQADYVKLKGAAPRKHYADHPQPDVDDVIRAEEDPNFSQYLRERERQRRADDVARLNFDRQQRAEEEAYEQARIEYINHESGKTTTGEMKKYRQYLRDKRAYRLQQEKYRREFVKAQQEKDAKLQAERIARLQQFIAPQRLPASQ